MSEYVAHEEKIGALRLRVIADNDASNPRTAWDQVSVMCCDHRRYDLGDADAHDTVADMIRASRDYRASWEEDDGKAWDFSTGPDLYKAVLACSDIVSLPCYLYDHSGITMSTGSFSCPWDSGQVGFIAISKAKILETYMKPEGSRLTAALKEKATALLASDVATYDMYLTGDVYGYTIDLANGDDLPDGDSCWDIFGQSYAIEEGQAALKATAAANPDLAAMTEEEVEEMEEA